MNNTETPMEIRAVLDCSALQSYARGHVHVGELLVDVADEGAYFGIPAAALTEAYAAAQDDRHEAALIYLFTTLVGTTVLDLDSETASDMAGTLLLTDKDMSRAHAVWAAHKYQALYLTTEPSEVVSLVPADQIHKIPAEDA